MPVSLQHHYATLNTTVEPTCEPVTLGEAFAYAEFEDPSESESERMRGLLVAARKKFERDTSRALMTQTRTATFDRFSPCGEQVFHVVPIQSVAITYKDENGATQIWGTGNYQTDFSNIPPRVAPVDGGSWPNTKCGTFKVATFTLVCGYGDSPDDVPDAAKAAIKQMAADWFLGVCTEGDVSPRAKTFIDSLMWRPEFL